MEPSNLLQIPNTESNSRYLAACRELGIKEHPARFPAKLPQFFIRFLTQPGDVVVDIFAGSNTTGFVCEQEDRHWLAFEENREYLAASAFRFLKKECSKEELEIIYKRIVHGEEQEQNILIERE